MAALLDSLFKLTAVVIAAILIGRVALLLGRVRYAQALLATPAEQRARARESSRRVVGLIRPILRPLPIAGLFVAVLVHAALPEVDAWVVYLTAMELSLLLLAEYAFETWLVRYVTEHEGAPPAAMG